MPVFKDNMWTLKQIEEIFDRRIQILLLAYEITRTSLYYFYYSNRKTNMKQLFSENTHLYSQY